MRLARLSRPCLASARARIAIAVIVLAAGAASAGAARMVAPYPYRPKEFDIVRQGTLFHLFYIRQDLTLVADSTTIDFGHAISTNFYDWVEQEPVLRVRAGAWDNFHVWAPSILRVGDLWYMFYTGVTHVPGQYTHHQRTGLATSPDLWTWTRRDEPVFECADVPWSYCDPLHPLGGDFRDPSVIPDPGQPGAWLMYYAARPAIGPDQMLIGVARSDGDPTQWTDLRPLWNTAQFRTYSALVESPEVVEHDGLWYLFYTTNSGHPISYQYSADPLADTTGWSPQYRLFHEVPEETTDPWFGIEFFRDQGRDYLLAANSASRSIEIREVVWDDPPHFHLIEPNGEILGAAAGPASGLVLARIPAAPGHARFRVSVPAATRALLEVFDAQGRRLRRLLDASLVAGATEVAWDGTAPGGPALPGIYFARLRTAAGDRVVRFPLAR